MKHILTRSTKIALEIVLFVVLISTVALALFRVFFSQLDRYKPQLEAWASSALHQPVKIRHIKASWNGIHPSIRMEEVDVLDTDQQTQRLHIQRLQVDVRLFSSLLQRRFVPSAMAIVGTHLQIHAIDADSIEINGIPVSLPSSRETNSTLAIGNTIHWLLQQGNISLENIDLDWKTQTGQLFQFTQVSIKLRNTFFKTDLRGVLTLAGKLPASARFVIRFAQGGKNAQAYLFVQHLDLTPWLSSLPVQKIQMTQGKIENMRLWAVWENKQWQSVQTTLTLKEAQLTSPYFTQPIPLDVFSGNIAWEKRPDGFALAADKVSLQLAQKTWPLTQWTILQSTANTGALTQVAHIDTLDIAQLDNFTRTFIAIPPSEDTAPDTEEGKQTVAPKAAGISALLTQLKPQGRLTEILLRRDTPPTGEALLSASFGFSALKTEPFEKIPAVNGLEGEVKIAPTMGDLQLKGETLALDTATFFGHPIRIDTYQGRIQWLKQAEGLTLRAKDIALSNDTLALQTDLALQLPLAETESPYVDLSAQFTEQGSQHIRDYLPLGILHNHPALTKWLTEAFVAGKGASGEIRLQGPLSHFPFDDQNGLFSAVVNVEDMQFNYKTGWPMFSHLDAQAVFKGRSLNITGKEGAQILDTETGPVKAEIPDLQHAVLSVQGKLTSDLKTGLRFIAESPLQKTIGEGLENLRAQGGMDLDLGLHIPLHPGEAPATVQGDVSIAPGSIAEIPAWKLHLTDMSGKLRFTENSLSAEKLSAQWEGKPVAIQIQTKKTGADTHTIEVSAKGRTTTAALEKTYPSLPLKEKFKGELPYQVLFSISRKEGHPQMLCSIDSDLQGLAIDLPAPFKKAATEKSPTHVDIQLPSKTALRVAVDYAKKWKANVDFAQNTAKAWSLKQADMQFSADTPSVFGIALASARLQVQPVQIGWTLNIDSPEVRGACTIPRNTATPWKGYFSRFRIIPSTANKTENTVHPGDIPSLDLEFKEFYYGAKPVGSVSLLTTTGKNFLEIARLKVNAGDTTLVARGRWQESLAGHQQTTLSGNLRSNNIGATLNTWQVTSSVAGGQGRAAFALSWPAAAYNFSFATLNGAFSLFFEKGRIINISDSKAAEMGIGRILNLLSLQSIPRRLTLDFSDLLQKGFPFDVMKGELNLQNGQALTQDAYLDGPIAKIAIKGRIGMANKDYDLLMMTTPYLTSSLPVAATILGGPIAGAATWLGSKVLSSVVDSITMHTYKVTGPWDKPSIESFSNKK